jgi:hypothetical protein
MFNFRLVTGFGLLLMGMFAPCMAQETIKSEANEASLANVKVLETGLLKNVTGYQGDVLGAEVILVTTTDDGLSELIEISIPIDPDLADRVSVESFSGQRIKLKKPMEISRDHENNKVGIILKLPRKSKLGFKIKLIDVPDE